MATVFLARDLKHDRLVALKVLHPELAASLGPERFLREIKVAARLNHPYIVPLHDSGQAGDLLYYVMPYVDGESPEDSALLYNVACVHALAEQTDDAIGCLEKAIQNGFGHREWLENDSDLDSVRGDPRFEVLRRKL